MKSRLTFFVLAICLATHGICADSISCKFRTLGIGLPEMKLRYTSKGKSAEIPVSPDVRSDVAAYSGPAHLVLSQVPGSGKFEADIPTEAKLVLLVFEKSANGTTQVRVLDESPDAFPPGSTLVVNYSDAAFGLRFGEQKFDLPAGELKLISAPGGSAKTQFVQILRDGAEGTDAVFSNNWAANPALRTLMIIEKSGDSDAVTVKRISEAAPISKP